MRTEHAITCRGHPTIAELDYLIRKANRLGLIGKEIISVYEREDDEGKHLFYEVKSNHFLSETEHA